MPKKKPNATVVIRFFDEKTEVVINGFEKLSPAKIQRSFDFVLKEWHTQQQRAIQTKRREDQEAQLKAIAAEREGEQDAAR